MGRFRYRMQNILDVKMKLEEQAKNEYAIARARLSEEEEKKQQLIDRKAHYEELNKQLKQDAIKIRDLIENYQAIETMKELIAKQEIQIKRAEAKLEEERAKLQEIMQERKTHDKLKEKAFEQFMKDENARESKEIDELTSYTYGKTGGNGE